MAEYGVGIMGMGWVAGAHLRAWNNNPHTQVVGVASRTPESARYKLAELGASCRVYGSYEEMLADPEIHIISICTPPNLHVENAVAATQAGKHICLEKPIALNLADLRRLESAVRASGVKSVVSFVLRWNPLFETIKAFQAQDAIGHIYYAETDYFNGGGPLFKQFAWNIKKEAGGSSLLSAGCHAVDALRWFVGAEATEVRALAVRSASSTAQLYEYNPTEVLLVTFANGVVGKVTSSLDCNMPYVFNVLLLGHEGTIRNNEIWSKKAFPGQTGFVSVPTILPDSADVNHHPFQGQMDHFVECIRSGVESHCNIADAVKTHELCLAADRSAENGGEAVRLPLE